MKTTDRATYPTGTTKEQWDAYHEAVKRHEEFIKNYKFFFDRICRQLLFIDPNKCWSVDEMASAISNEIKMTDSMDAPNEPGYYRANND